MAKYRVYTFPNGLDFERVDSTLSVTLDDQVRYEENFPETIRRKLVSFGFIDESQPIRAEIDDFSIWIDDDSGNCLLQLEKLHENS